MLLPIIGSMFVLIDCSSQVSYQESGLGLIVHDVDPAGLTKSLVTQDVLENKKSSAIILRSCRGRSTDTVMWLSRRCSIEGSSQADILSRHYNRTWTQGVKGTQPHTERPITVISSTTGYNLDVPNVSENRVDTDRAGTKKFIWDSYGTDPGVQRTLGHS